MTPGQAVIRDPDHGVCLPFLGGGRYSDTPTLIARFETEVRVNMTVIVPTAFRSRPTPSPLICSHRPSSKLIGSASLSCHRRQPTHFPTAVDLTSPSPRSITAAASNSPFGSSPLELAIGSLTLPEERSNDRGSCGPSRTWTARRRLFLFRLRPSSIA